MIKVAPQINGGKDDLYSSWCWENLARSMEKNKTRSLPYTKVDSRWIKDFKVKGEIYSS